MRAISSRSAVSQGSGCSTIMERGEIKVSSFKFQVSSNNGVDEKIIVGAPSRGDQCLIAPRRRKEGVARGWIES